MIPREILAKKQQSKITRNRVVIWFSGVVLCSRPFEEGSLVFHFSRRRNSTRFRALPCQRAKAL